MKALVVCFVSVVLCACGYGKDWPEWRGEGRRGVWKEDGLVTSFEDGALKFLWRAPIGPGYNGPTVKGPRIYAMDRGLDAQANLDIERVICYDRETGEVLWEHQYLCRYQEIGYPLGPRGSVTVVGGRSYAMGAMGHLHCLDAATGEVIWRQDLAEEYEIAMPVWGLSSSPLVEGGLVIVNVGAASERASVVAFDRESGKEVWRQFDDRIGYTSPMVIVQGGRRVVVVWTGFRIAGLDVPTGEVLWEHETKPNRMPINVPDAALDEIGERLFLSTFYDGSRVLELGQGENLGIAEVWRRRGVSERRTDALHCMISPPYLYKGFVYGIDSYGELRCLDLATGDRIWESIGEVVPTGRWSTVFMVRNGEHTWMFTERGELILARLSPEGYEEVSRAQLLEPTTSLRRRGEREPVRVVWSHPAFANRCIYARNDHELVCVDLSASPRAPDATK
ncbi:MAG: PQQ-binding-like beta-propeller repeat protein [Verrucomicrobiota bacterium]